MSASATQGGHKKFLPCKCPQFSSLKRNACAHCVSTNNANFVQLYRPILDVSQSIFDSFWYTIYSDPQILIERQFTIYPFRRVYTLLRLVVKSSKFTSKSTHYSSVHSQVQVQKTQVTAHRVIIHQENVEKSGNYCKLVREKSGETTCIMSFCKPARANTLNSEIEFQLCLRFSTSLAPNNVFLVL